MHFFRAFGEEKCIKATIKCTLTWPDILQRKTMITGPAYMPPFQLSIYSGGFYTVDVENSTAFLLILIYFWLIQFLFCPLFAIWSVDALWIYFYTKDHSMFFICSKICLIKSLPKWCSEVFAYHIQDVLRKSFSLQNKKMKSSFNYVSR